MRRFSIKISKICLFLMAGFVLGCSSPSIHEKIGRLPSGQTANKSLRPTVQIKGERYTLIPEILDLENGAAVPQELYERFDSRLIGASLISRLHSSRESNANVSDPETNFWKETKIQMRFDPQFIESIKKNGFLNLHQVGHSNGDFERANRAENESAFVGVKLL